MKGLLHLKLYCETNVSRPRNKREKDLCSLYVLTSAFMKVREKKGVQETMETMETTNESWFCYTNSLTMVFEVKLWLYKWESIC